MNRRETMDKHLLFQMNWSLVFLTFVLFFIGIVNLYSAGALLAEEGMNIRNFYQKQLLWGCAGFILMLVAMFFDYRHLRNITLFLYIFAIILLILVLLV